MAAGSMAAPVDMNWTDDFYYYAVNEPITFQEAYAVANARVGYTSGNGNWQVALWMKNLTDKDYNIFRLDVGTLAYCACGLAAPGWVGGTVSYRW